MVQLPLDKTYRIGRASDNDLVFQDPTVSRHHATIEWTPNGFLFEDRESSTGTWLGTENIQKRILLPGDLLRIGVQRIRYHEQDGSSFLEHLPALDATLFLEWDKEIPIRIGRSPQSQIQISHPLCPMHLGALQHKGDFISIQSKHSLFPRKNRKPPFQLTLPFGILDVQAKGLEWIPNASGFQIEAHGLGIIRSEKQILSDIHFKVSPGEIVAIVGRSGHGKSTLLRTLSGEYELDQGQLTLNPSSRQQIAWLQQDAPLYPYLTVEESLQDACTLRLPADTSKAEIQERVTNLLKKLGLEKLRQSLNRNLSGGEQRRVALACELVSSPGLVLLDEPFAGLDAVHVKSMASWFRQLGWAGHTLILTTHDYAILPHVDKVLVLHEGKQAFFGSPQSALKAFGTENPAEMLQLMEDHQSSTQTQIHTPAHVQSHLPKSNSGIIHVQRRSPIPFLLRRFLKTLVRDRGRLVASVLQPFVIAGLLTFLFQPTSSLWIAAFALNLCINWFGMSGAIREVVAYKRISEQEWARGLSPFTDLFTKWVALFGFAFVQSAACALILKWVLQWQGSSLSLLGLTGVALAAPVAAGLMASALARSAGQANAMLPLLLIPQVMFAGALVPLDQMSATGRWIAKGLWSSWSQSALQDLLTSTPINTMDLSIPALIALGIVIICAWVLKAKITRNILSTSTKNTM